MGQLRSLDLRQGFVDRAERVAKLRSDRLDVAERVFNRVQLGAQRFVR